MKFDIAIGNPPYQEENNNNKLYPAFYLEMRSISLSTCLIFPTAWQEPHTQNGYGKINKKEIKEDPQIVCIKNVHGAFPGVAGAEHTNIILWRKDYNNGLNGKQLIYDDNGSNVVKLYSDVKDIKKQDELIELDKHVLSQDFTSMQSIMSVRSPYGLPTDIIGNEKKYGLPQLLKDKPYTDCYRVIHTNTFVYAPTDYPFPRTTIAFNHYKVLIPNAWGNLSDQYIGGAYANIFIAQPGDACTETLYESGSFLTAEEAKKHAKYIMTKFVRALLWLHKYNILSISAWESVPLQDYTEQWWNDDIDSIDEHLFEKYNVPEYIRQFVRENIQPRTEENIIDLSKT